jgi:hypothetical protein
MANLREGEDVGLGGEAANGFGTRGTRSEWRGRRARWLIRSECRAAKRAGVVTLIAKSAPASAA